MKKSLFLLLLGILLGWFAKGQFGNQFNDMLAQISAPTIEKKAVKQPPKVQTAALNQAKNPIQSDNIEDIYSPERLMKNAKNAIAGAQYQQALIHIENLLIQVQERYRQQDVEKMFVDTLSLYMQQLGDNNPEQKIIFLNRAADILPNQLQFRYLLAKLFLAIEDYQQVQYQLSFLAHNINWKVQFDKLQAQLDYARIFQQGGVEIPLIKLSNAWHIEVMINGVVARFIVDTGASITTISSSLIAVNYPRSGALNLSTANGKLKSFKVKVELVVGNFTKNPFPVAVVAKAKLPDGIDGLLGLDWLGVFNFVIDKKNSILRLTPIVK